MDVRVTHNGELVILASGDIDLKSVDRLSAMLQCAIEGSPNGFVIDMSDVTYIDSVGVGAVLGMYRSIAKTGGRVALVAAHRNVKDIFDVICAVTPPGFRVCANLTDAERWVSGTADVEDCLDALSLY